MEENIYTMDETRLRQYAHEMGLIGACVDTLVHRVVYGKSWATIVKDMSFS